MLVLLSASTAYGGGQLRHQRRLRRVLRAQGVLPRRLHATIAGVVAPVELATATTVVTLLTAASRRTYRWCGPACRRRRAAASAMRNR
jgi:hypothetical protein